ncbi:MAG: hypothetical protein C0594_09045 [Marinilabiliales bacterium]|nr:MAG: hypothetical protein C0594_09045 [Marinilabiliales bacterium]
MLIVRKLLFLLLLIPFTSALAQNQHEKIVDSIFTKYNIRGGLLIFSDYDTLIHYYPENLKTYIPVGEAITPFISLCALNEKIIVSNHEKLPEKFYNTNLSDVYKNLTLNDLKDKDSQFFTGALAHKLRKRKLKKYLKTNHYTNKELPKNLRNIVTDSTLKFKPYNQLLLYQKLLNNKIEFSDWSKKLVKQSFESSDSLNNRYYFSNTGFKSSKKEYTICISGYYIIKDTNYYISTVYSFPIQDITRLNKTIFAGPQIITEALQLLELLPKKKIKKPKPKPSLDEMIGQMILVGVDGNKVDSSNSTIKAIQKGTTGGVILYEKNISSTHSEQNLKALVDSLQHYSKIPLFICIDQEGGKVNRLKEKYGFPASVSAAHLGNVNNIDTTYYYSELMAKTLKNIGININFAPVLDLSVQDNFIKKYERCFSDDPEITTKHAIEFIKGHRKHNCGTVVKHFPGHGSADGNSHFNMVNVTNSWQEFELIPYKNIIDSGYCDAVMTAHIINFKLEEDTIPSTLSYKVIQELLRDSLGFEGVVFSDDMQMKAISDYYGFKKAVKLAINAGVDVLMYSHNIRGTTDRQAEKIHKTIKKLVEEGDIKKERIEEAYNRIISLKKQIKAYDEE